MQAFRSRYPEYDANYSIHWHTPDCLDVPLANFYNKIDNDGWQRDFARLPKRNFDEKTTDSTEYKPLHIPPNSCPFHPAGNNEKISVEDMNRWRQIIVQAEWADDHDSDIDYETCFQTLMKSYSPVQKINGDQKVENMKKLFVEAHQHLRTFHKCFPVFCKKKLIEAFQKMKEWKSKHDPLPKHIDLMFDIAFERYYLWALRQN